jgi:hypothetical protein
LLTEYERAEIQSYNEIYFFGLDAEKVHGKESSRHHNGGYDDENGSYNKVQYRVIYANIFKWLLF